MLYGSQLRSYRDLPIRYAEAAPLHRNELAGTLHGLTRVRYVTQDDAHIFCTRDQIPAELDVCLDYLRFLYGLFGVEPHAELSTRPTTSSAATRSGTSPKANCSLRSTDTACRTSSERGRGRFYGRRSTCT